MLKCRMLGTGNNGAVQEVHREARLECNYPLSQKKEPVNQFGVHSPRGRPTTHPVNVLHCERASPNCDYTL